MTIKNFAKWLLETFPENAHIVETNSLAWNNNSVRELTRQDVEQMFYLHKSPEYQNGKKINYPCVVMADEEDCDY
jgi:hypothetical protein